MAGDRLENWSTLNHADLQDRVDKELQRSDLSFAEQQLLDAAQERLRKWREPRKRSSMVDDKKSDPTSNEEADPDKETKMVTRKTSKVRAGKGRTAGKKTVPTRKGATRTRLDPTAKVMKGTGENPFKEGSGSFKRTEIMLKNAIGKTVEQARALKGTKPTTLNTLVNMGTLKVAK